MVEVVFTDQFEAWFDDLRETMQDDVVAVVALLEERGVTLGHPYSSDVKSAKTCPMRELRIQSGGHPVRVFYAFDPRRQAVLLIGGDKTGQDRFYETFVPAAEKLWAEYLDETNQRRKT